MIKIKFQQKTDLKTIPYTYNRNKTIKDNSSMCMYKLTIPTHPAQRSLKCMVNTRIYNTDFYISTRSALIHMIGNKP